MPAIAVLDGGITIAIYYNDHNPPHFHAMQAEHEILVEIVPKGGVFAGSAPPAMVRQVLDWAEAHRAELAQCWAQARAGRPLGRIA